MKLCIYLLISLTGLLYYLLIICVYIIIQILDNVYTGIDACKTGNKKTVISHKLKSGLSHQINAAVLILYKKSNFKFLLFQLVLYIFYNLILRHSIKIIKKNITPFLYCRCYTICGIFHKDKYSIITVKNLINPFCKIL